MARQFCLSVLVLLLATGTTLADEALAQAMARVKKAGGQLKKDAKTGSIDQLFLDDALATDEDVAAVVDALKKARPESKVHIRQVFLGPARTDAAVKKVAELETFAFLCIRPTKVTDKGLAALKPLTKLTTLRANQTAITDEGLKHLGEVKNLQQLFLDKTQITDEGLKHLQKLRLVVVSVKGTKVTEAGAKSLKGVTVDR
jgi:hypothetical protein